MTPTGDDWRLLLSVSSYRAPTSPILLFLLLDPYPPKQLRANLHSLFLSLIVDPRFKSRFAASLGAVACRPLSTVLFSALELARRKMHLWVSLSKYLLWVV